MQEGQCKEVTCSLVASAGPRGAATAQAGPSWETVPLPPAHRALGDRSKVTRKTQPGRAAGEAALCEEAAGWREEARGPHHGSPSTREPLPGDGTAHRSSFRRSKQDPQRGAGGSEDRHTRLWTRGGEGDVRRQRPLTLGRCCPPRWANAPTPCRQEARRGDQRSMPGRPGAR